MTTNTIRAWFTFLYSIPQKVLNLLFPKRSANIACNVLNQQINQLYSYADVFYSLMYRDAETKRVLWKFKYYLEPEAFRICTHILYDQLVADTSDRVAHIPFRTPYIILHYPSSSYFNGKKKFDHMKELLLLLDSLQDAHNPFFTCCTHAILPNQNSEHDLESQHAGSRRQRFEWSKQRFVLSPDFEKFMECHQKGIQDSNQGIVHTNVSYTSHIYCIDDVVTTGASLQAVSDILQEKYNVKVSKFCICH